MNNETLIDLGAVSEETLGQPLKVYVETDAPFECQDEETIPGCS